MMKVFLKTNYLGNLGNVLKAILDGQIYGGCQIAR